MLDFLKHLLDDGEIVVPRDVHTDVESVNRLLIFAERIWRQTWPGSAPRFDVERSAKAASVLCTFCRAAVYRELDEQSIVAELQQIGLEPADSVAAHYSVDLTLRFLPQVYERLSRVSQNDPILTHVLQVSRMWPLSSVGIPGSAPDTLPEAFRDRGLFRAYTDRVVSLGDQPRANLPEVAAAVAAALGPYDSLRAKCGLVSRESPPNSSSCGLSRNS